MNLPDDVITQYVTKSELLFLIFYYINCCVFLVGLVKMLTDYEIVNFTHPNYSFQISRFKFPEQRFQLKVLILLVIIECNYDFVIERNVVCIYLEHSFHFLNLP